MERPLGGAGIAAGRNIRIPMRHATARRRLAARPWAWLLALALVLPFAQLAAAAHRIEHVAAEAPHDSGAPAHLAAVCDLCLVGSTAGGPGLLPGMGTPALPDAAHTPPGIAPRPVPALRTTLPYRSRAPPFLPA